jgi:hypothetical protein
MGRRRQPTTGLLIVTAMALAACGGAYATGSAGLPSPSGGAPGSAMVVTRSGGIAGVHDVIEIDADGTARVTSGNGVARACEPDPSALAELRALDLAAVGSGSSTITDGFNYEVRTEGGVAAAGDGDNKGIRPAFVRAAAAVVNSCLGSASGSDAPSS